VYAKFAGARRENRALFRAFRAEYPLTFAPEKIAVAPMERRPLERR
jgi:hypothetical protein